MQLPIRVERGGVGGVAEWVLLELQGSLESLSGGELSGQQIGHLTYGKDGTPYIILGHHLLAGSEVEYLECRIVHSSRTTGAGR